MAAPLRVAVVGSGISGLAVAHTLLGQAEVTLFEALDYFGGHTHTVDITLPADTASGSSNASNPLTFGVDTGFLVFNERTYPNLINFLAALGVQTASSEMSFSVQVPGALNGRSLEWSGSSLDSVFIQRSNLFRPKFLGMLADLLRFNSLATQIAKTGQETALMQPLADFLDQHRFGQAFRDWYLLPMLGCIWSCPTQQMLQFPVATLVRFCHNHGLLQIANRPRWFTVRGGARHYVDKVVAQITDKRLNTPVKFIERDAQGVRIATETNGIGRIERFDKLVLATHSDQALQLLRDATPQEASCLGAIKYQDNHAVLHTDASVLPSQRKAWAAWNYERMGANGAQPARVCLHYHLNQLQPLPVSTPVVVSLNPLRNINRSLVMGEYHYAHPVFDLAAIQAQQQVAQLQGQQHTYFCGAWLGYGFHEDGLKSGLSAARDLLLIAQTRKSSASQ
ncbi:MAG: NAD(P)/FAD-dependent oxidoreductase [Burkholderiales bacterium]